MPHMHGAVEKDTLYLLSGITKPVMWMLFYAIWYQKYRRTTTDKIKKYHTLRRVGMYIYEYHVVYEYMIGMMISG